MTNSILFVCCLLTLALTACSVSKSFQTSTRSDGTKVDTTHISGALGLTAEAPATEATPEGSGANTRDIYARADVAQFDSVKWIGYVVLAIGVGMVILRLKGGSLPLVGIDMSVSGIIATFIFAALLIFGPAVYLAFGPLLLVGGGGAAWLTVVLGGNLTNWMDRKKRNGTHSEASP